MSFIIRVTTKNQLQGPPLVLNLQVCISKALITVSEHFGLLFSNQKNRREGSMNKKQWACDRDDDVFGSLHLHLWLCVPLFLPSSSWCSHQSGSPMIGLLSPSFPFYFSFSFFPSFLSSFSPSLHPLIFIQWLQCARLCVGPGEVEPRKLKGGIAYSAWKLAKVWEELLWYLFLVWKAFG